MQQEKSSRSNRARTEETRGRLIGAARRLFVEKSYAETGTPEIVREAGVTRGALYHHFADKQALFHAVVEQEAEQVACAVEKVDYEKLEPIRALIAGGDAYLTAMAEPGRTRLLLLDGPAVLGRPAMDEIDSRHGSRTLREGLATAMESGHLRKLPLSALTALLGAVYDRAALALEAGGAEEDYRNVSAVIINSLAC